MLKNAREVDFLVDFLYIQYVCVCVRELVCSGNNVFTYCHLKMVI